MIFSITELNFVRKTSFRLNSVKASSGLRKMFSQCSNQDVVWENVCLIKWTPIFIWLYWNLIGIGRCYYHLELIWKIDGFGLKLKLADVNANTMDDVNPLFHVMADVIAISWYCDSHYYLVGRCCCLIIWYRQMLLPCGWCNSHLFVKYRLMLLPLCILYCGWCCYHSGWWNCHLSIRVAGCECDLWQMGMATVSFMTIVVLWC